MQIIFTVWQMFCWGVEIFGSKSFGGKSLVLVQSRYLFTFLHTYVIKQIVELVDTVVSPTDLRTMILEKETELAKINKELKDLEHYKVGRQATIYLYGCQQHCKH